MLNKFFKTIHNKYSRFFEFIFFLRYLLIIFLFSIAGFLTMPIFFDYEKKAEAIKLHLQEDYNFEIYNYERIKYNIFPLPNLQLENVLIDLKSSEENLSVRKIKIFHNLSSIYNYKNFNSNKIILEDSEIKFQVANLKSLLKKLFFKKKKLYFDNLNLKIVDEKLPIISFKNIKFTNFGYNKNLLRGQVFGKKFKVETKNNFKNLSFRLLNSGFKADIIFDETQTKNLMTGVFKSKILNTNLKTNFKYDGKTIKIFNSYFRSKNIYLKNEIEIILSPYLDIYSQFIIEEFNSKIFKKVDLKNILRFKTFLRKINNESKINFKSQKFDDNFFDNIKLKVNLAYGRMNYSKKLSTGNTIIQCDGNINFLDEYPLLFFDCNLKSKSKKKFLKKFYIKTKNKKEILNLKVKGNLNIFNKKVNFKNILLNENFKASKENLKYFKNTFERILFDKNFFEIFDLKKIKDFIIEIS